jgi:catalase
VDHVGSDHSALVAFHEGFGIHTFRLVDADGQSTFVKFHWKPKLGIQSVVWNEALKIDGADPDSHRRDMWDSIQAGDFPEWELGLQLFDDEFADRFAFDVLDATKIIPEEEVPVRRVGRLVLDRCVDLVPTPSAFIRKISARQTSLCGALRSRASVVKRRRAAGL